MQESVFVIVFGPFQETGPPWCLQGSNYSLGSRSLECTSEKTEKSFGVFFM